MSSTQTISMTKPPAPQKAVVPDYTLREHGQSPILDNEIELQEQRDGQGSSRPSDRTFAVQERWNNPRSNTYRLAAVFYSFLVFGMNDASYGALLPSIEAYYGLTYLVVSLIFLSPFVGYTVAALLSSPLHHAVGQRGIAVIALGCRLVAYIVISVRPPYGVIVAVLAIAGLGNGLIDAAWNAYVGNLVNANEILGIMHGFYGLGAVISPLVATAMVDTYRLPFNSFFWVMTSLAVVDLLVNTAAFWKVTGKVFRDSHPRSEGEGGSNKLALQNKVTWICSAFLLCYVGCEVSISGWIVTFMINVRKAQPFSSGLTSTGFWLGITLGRVVLGFITPRIGEKLAVSIYLGLSIGFELLFWLVPQFIVSAVAVALVGFFLGPLFPAAVVATTKLLPPRLHVSAVGISASIGGAGAAAIPFAVGAIAAAKGVQTLQPIILALLAVQLGVWLLLPRIPRHAHAE